MLSKQKEQDLNRIRFEPKINRKSEIIVGKKLENIYTKVFGANRQSKNGSISSKVTGPIKKHAGKHEAFLINKAIAVREKQAEKAAFIETKEIENCTFSPKINKTIKKTSRSQSQGCVHDLRQSKSQENCLSHPESEKQSKSTVFIQLYKIARERKEKSLESNRRAHQIKLEKETQECTFKPDFSKTQKKFQVQSRYLTHNRPSSAQVLQNSTSSQAGNKIKREIPKKQKASIQLEKQ